jgi:hypothetical protein
MRHAIAFVCFCKKSGSVPIRRIYNGKAARTRLLCVKYEADYLLGNIKLYARTNRSRQAVERNDQTGAYPVTDVFFHFGRSLCQLWSMEISLASAWRVNFTTDNYDCLSFIAYERSLCRSHPRA